MIKHKITRYIIAFAAALALGGVTTVTAATLTVANATSLPCTGTFPTIQSAITAASPGDTISVCQGTYNEQVQVTKTLILQGAQHGVDARTRATTSESIINYSGGPVQIMADNVTLDGFTIQGSTGTDPNFLAGIWTNPGYSGTQGGHQILNNIVQNNISGIELDSTCAANPTLVQYNLIRNNNNPGPGSGNAIQTNFGLCNATIDSNKFSGHASSSVLIVAASSGLTVSNNELVGGTPEGIAFLNVSNSTISGNTSIGSTSGGTIDLFGGDSNITVDSNVLRNGMRAIWVENPYAIYGVVPNSGISGHMNCITGNSVAGLEVDAGGYSGGPGTLDAQNNWWGSASGPMIASNPSGTGDKIIDPDGVVDYTPFLTSAATTPCFVPCPNPNPGCTTNKKDCDKFVDQQKKDFEAMQKADKEAFNSQPHTKQEKKDFEHQQQAAKKTFEDQQKADKKQCKDLPK
jgi:nitrous oxidase accessory protein NosD